MSKQRLLLLIPLLLFLLLSLILRRGLTLDPHQLPSVFINKPVPKFILPDLIHPDQFFSTQNFPKQIILLNIWATWCSNCQMEHPVLVDIAANQHIPIYGIDYKDSRIDAMNWLHQFGNPYRAIGFDSDGKAAINLGVYGTPETFIIDRNGIIRYKYIGPITLEVWKDKLLPEIIILQRKQV